MDVRPETVAGHGVPGSDILPFCFFLSPEGVHRKPPCLFEPDDDSEPLESARPISLDSVVSIERRSSPARTP
jgi:hypothetical protein